MDTLLSLSLLKTGGMALSIALFSAYLKWPHKELNKNLIEDLAYNYYTNYNKRESKSICKSPLSGVIVVITGGTSGIGRNLALLLYDLGATIYIVGRSKEKMQQLKEEALKISAKKKADCCPDEEISSKVVLIEADFSDLASVSKAANEILKECPTIDFLINNAGIAYTASNPLPNYLSVQGYDLLFAVNYLSHVLLTEKLLPVLATSKLNPRIIQVSSSFHWLMNTSELVPICDTLSDAAPIASQNKENKEQCRAYANSKLAQILHARALSRKLQQSLVLSYSNIKVISICPGWVHTNIVPSKIGQLFLKTFGFPANGIGLSSILNAMFRTHLSGDYVTNFHFPFLMDLIPTSDLATKLYLRDFFVASIATTFINIWQKLCFRSFCVCKSSPDSYILEAQDQLYSWSLKAVQKWL